MRSLVTLLVLTAGLARADKVPPSATDVVKEAIKAAGGTEVLEKFKAGSMKIKGEVSEMGITAEVDGKVTYMTPDRMRMTMTATVMGQKFSIDQVMKGKVMKMSLNGADMPVDDRTKKQLTSGAAEQEIGQFVVLLDPKKKYAIKLGDEAEIHGKKTVVVVVNNEDLGVKDFKLFFDAKTHLLLKTQKKDRDSTDAEVDEETFYSDYKAVQGVQTAHTIATKHDGKDYMKFTVSDVKYAEKLDDKEFPTDD
jgi:hypothetical protein